MDPQLPRGTLSRYPAAKARPSLWQYFLG